MSHHIRLKEYNCPNCNALYVPYKVDMPCPNCKKISDNVPQEYWGFIDELIISLRMNKINGGRYLPGAWYTGSFTEYIQEVVFHTFDALDRNKKDTVEVFINKYLDSIEWDKEALYRKEYIHSIFLEIYSRKDELSVSLWIRLLHKLPF